MLLIRPVLKRELLVIERRRPLRSDLSSLAGWFLGSILLIFAAWYYLSGQHVSRSPLSVIAWQSFLWIALLHFYPAMAAAVAAVRSIAIEKERRTLDSLLATPLTAADIILGKLAASCVHFTTLLAGFPVLLLLHVIGGVDAGLIALKERDSSPGSCVPAGGSSRAHPSVMMRFSGGR